MNRGFRILESISHLELRCAKFQHFGLKNSHLELEWSFRLLVFKGLYRDRVWGVLMFKNFKATEKSFLDVRHNFGGKILV